MKKTVFLLLCSVVLVSSVSYAGLFDSIFKSSGSSSSTGLDESTTISGLKEALAIGTENAVQNVSQVDGYFGNSLIKILMPEKIQNVADVLGKLGFQKEVDEFVLSMNRAAEKAAPEAASIFGDAIREMTIQDAVGILNGGDTAATDFFEEKTHDRLYGAFKPIISSSMDEVGATKSYKNMMGRYETIPFMDKRSLDLDHYVTDKSLDGLFYMVGQEEKKIRTDPAARVTDLLQTVFGK
ncbi:MAG: DUF4197 domain-containing protein [Nitrospiraceae bacterium]|nr:MAG: DUF4197 domain-containing protein [Nitrospiraceae bacterium]